MVVIVGGAIGGVVFLTGAALLAVMWKTGRLKDCKCGGCAGGCKPGPSEPAAAPATAGTQYPVVIATPGSQYPVPVAPLADAAATQKPAAGAPPASDNLPTLPPPPAYSTIAKASSASTAHVQ